MRITAVVTMALALTLAAGQGAQAAEPIDYVALGDSFAAGPWIPPNDTNPDCRRSTSNYPHVAAKALGARLVDVSCSGATIGDFSSNQFPSTPPQYAALNEGVELVTLTIGGNDIGLFGDVIKCLNLLPEPLGTSCKDRLTAGGVDQLHTRVDALTTVFGTALDTIRQRAPHAKIMVVGYATFIKPGGCFPVQPIWGKDADYIQGTLFYLNAMLRTETERRGGTFVDTATLTVDHDTCALPRDRYLEGVIPGSAAAPLHPNAKGMAVFGKAVATAAS
jgi:lysophospholipase L1-like esterase